MQWVSRYNGPANCHDRVVDLAVDDDGFVYVTGVSRDFFSDNRKDYLTVKYNSNGIQQWVARYNGTGDSYDEVKDLTVDKFGNVYVTGSSNNISDNSDYATIKYDNAGVEQWAARYNGPTNGNDGATALAVDDQGNVYVTGGSNNISDNSDYVTIKYDNVGVSQWVARYSGPTTGNDRATALAVDNLGNVFVTGWSDTAGTWDSSDCVTIKYNSSGVEQWVTSYNGGDAFGVSKLALDDAGFVYVTAIDTGSNWVIIKYNNDGIEQWVARYNEPGSWHTWINALVVEDGGNVYVCGASDVTGTGEDFVTIKFDASGEQQWVVHYNGVSDGWDYATALAVDDESNVYVTGESSIWSSNVFTTIKYVQVGTGVLGQIIGEIPKNFLLKQNYPNPFNPVTTINYQLPQASKVALSVYNILGQKVAMLANSGQSAGYYKVQWDASGFASGIYFYRLETDKGFVQSRKLILLK